MLWKRGEIAPKEQFLLFSTIFSIYGISNLRSQITHSFMKCGCLIYFFLNFANLICRSMDISKYFREFLDFKIKRVDYIDIFLTFSQKRVVSTHLKCFGVPTNIRVCLP